MLITFHPLQTSHFPLLVIWFNTAHIKHVWTHHEPWTLASVREKYTTYVQGHKIVNGTQKPLHAFIVNVDGEPIGYIQYYNAYDFPRDHGSLSSTFFPHKLATLDFFIGDPNYLGKGLGTAILRNFLSDYIWKNFDACFVDPETDNIAAVKTYQKAGFTFIKEEDTATWMIILKPSKP